jgi:hypothetical protein
MSWKPTEEYFLWHYYAGVLADVDYNNLYTSLEAKWKPNNSRRSCLFTARGNGGKSNYSGMPVYSWIDDVPVIDTIRKRVCEGLNENYEFVLVHYYPGCTDDDGKKSTIAYHFDKEALVSDVASISFGHPRKFRFRKRGDPSIGYFKEYELQHGDLLHMLAGCQKQWLHGVPPQANVLGRINFTFRKYQ